MNIVAVGRAGPRGIAREDEGREILRAETASRNLLPQARHGKMGGLQYGYPGGAALAFLQGPQDFI